MLCFSAAQGCFTLVTSGMEANLGIIAGISFGIAFFQVNCVSLCTYLHKSENLHF